MSAPPAQHRQDWSPEPAWRQGPAPSQRAGNVTLPAGQGLQADREWVSEAGTASAAAATSPAGGLVPVGGLGQHQRAPWSGHQDAQGAHLVASQLAPSPQSVVAVPPNLEGDAGYGQWGSMQMNSMEQKMSAMSRRTQAELRRAEKERGEHSRRLEALEEICRQHLGDLDDRLQQAREEAASEAERVSKKSRDRFERDLKTLAEDLQQRCNECSLQENEAFKALSRRMDADHETLEELRVWRREAEHRLFPGANGERGAGGKSIAAAATRDELTERFEEQLESSLARERKQAHERLRSSCTELTAHLNELRRELVEQRVFVEQNAQGLEARRERLRQDLETQIAELGGALATRLQAKISSTSKALEEHLSEVTRGFGGQFGARLGALEERSATFEWIGGQLPQWRQEHAELSNGVQSLQEIIRRQHQEALEAAREEARTVHLEVMSVDTRVAGLEERMADDPGRRRYDALLRMSGERLPVKPSKIGE